MRKSISKAAALITKGKNEKSVVINKDCSYQSPSPEFLDRKIDFAIADLCSQQELSKGLHGVSPENALIISEYIKAMMTESNPSDNYRRDNIRILCIFSKYNKDKPFKAITRNDIISFLDRYRKSEAADPLHKWIGTYNLFKIYLLRFFKWLYYPDIEPDNRPKPDVIDNIPQLKICVIIDIIYGSF